MTFKSKNLPSNCPPSNARCENIEIVYRLTEKEEPCEGDFLDHFENDLYDPRKHAGRECDACALSFYTEKSDLEKMQKKFPAMNEKVISVGQITKDCGIHTIKRRHINLWLYKNVDMVKIFTEKLEGED